MHEKESTFKMNLKNYCTLSSFDIQDLDLRFLAFIPIDIPP